MTHTYQIVVGVDGSDGGRRALLWAVREAAARGGTVQAVTAWHWDGFEEIPPGAMNPAEAKARAERMLTRELETLPMHERTGLPIALEAVEGRPAAALTAAAGDADLLVLGSHGHGRIRHSMLGSVSEECVRKAVCPVVVVPVPHAAPQAATPATLP
ncbi:universal stress protein [Actinomycetes bacterium KLBMP 9797]